MGVKLCCSDTREQQNEPELKRFETFGCTDTPPVPNPMYRLEDQEVNIIMNEDEYYNNRNNYNNTLPAKSNKWEKNMANV